jgi:transposase
MLADIADAVIGVDTHTDTHTACLLDRLGRQIAVITVPADAAGCRALLAWAQQHAPGQRLAWSVEGSRSHGLGLTRYLQAQGQLVAEAARPQRAGKRPGGKSDPADAATAARHALSADRLAQPRADGTREALRILLVARAQMATARTAAVNTLKALLLGAPDDLRQQLRVSTPRQVSRCRALRVRASQPVAEQVLRAELRRLATHIGALDKELRASKTQLRRLVAQTMPVLLEQPGVGPVCAAQLLVSWSHKGRCRSEAAFAALGGVSPLPASSGRITRHRLNRFGDRDLNKALHVIINWRMLHHAATQHYLTRRRAQQKTNPEIRRCLKRYAARQLFRLMEAQPRLDNS